MTPLYALEQLTVLLPQSGFVQRPLSFTNWVGKLRGRCGHLSEMATNRSSGLPPRNAPNGIRRPWRVYRDQSGGITSGLSRPRVWRPAMIARLQSRARLCAGPRADARLARGSTIWRSPGALRWRCPGGGRAIPERLAARLRAGRVDQALRLAPQRREKSRAC